MGGIYNTGTALAGWYAAYAAPGALGCTVPVLDLVRVLYTGTCREGEPGEGDAAAQCETLPSCANSATGAGTYCKMVSM